MSTPHTDKYLVSRIEIYRDLEVRSRQHGFYDEAVFYQAMADTVERADGFLTCQTVHPRNR